MALGKFSKAAAAASALALLAGVANGQVAFTVNCAPLTIQRADPIVNPGVISGHVHAVVGGTAFKFELSNEEAKASKATTCNKILDHSNYWQPQLYHERQDGKFEIVPFDGAVAYYLKRTCDYEEGRQYCDGAKSPIAPPAGLRMLVGSPSRRDYNDTNFEHRAVSHHCLDPENEIPELPGSSCQRLRAQTFFPSCWNGRDLDSNNHKDHVAFPARGNYNGGVCPESHPVAIFSVFYEFFYDMAAIQDVNRWVWAHGDSVGYGLHGDYLQGWTDQEALELAMDTCTGPGGVEDPDCSLNVGPNGPGVEGPQELETPPPDEEVGLNGPLDKLPGNNPVSS